MSFVFGDMIERHLLDHPAVKEYKDVKKHVKEATEHLAKAYMKIGALELEVNNK
jgi:hypothetical protein